MKDEKPTTQEDVEKLKEDVEQLESQVYKLLQHLDLEAVPYAYEIKKRKKREWDY